jgi:hypothetical protein
MRLRFMAIAVIFSQIAWAIAQDAAQADKVYQAAVEKADKQRSIAIAAADTDYIQALKKVVTAETKKGNLDAALEARNKLNAVDKKEKTEGVPAVIWNRNALMAKLAGTKWGTTKKVIFEWKMDGTFLHKGGPRICVPVGPTKAIIYFDNNRVDVLEFNKELTQVDHWQLTSSSGPIENVKFIGR